MVRIHPDPPPTDPGAVAQLGEHLLCKQGVVGSIPISSTNHSAPKLAGGWGIPGVVLKRSQRQAGGLTSGFLPERIGCSLTIGKK